jgi:hypothetical protein
MEQRGVSGGIVSLTGLSLPALFVHQSPVVRFMDVVEFSAEG